MQRFPWNQSGLQILNKFDSFKCCGHFRWIFSDVRLHKPSTTGGLSSETNKWNSGGLKSQTTNFQASVLIASDILFDILQSTNALNSHSKPRVISSSRIPAISRTKILRQFRYPPHVHLRKHFSSTFFPIKKLQILNFKTFQTLLKFCSLSFKIFRVPVGKTSNNFAEHTPSRSGL